MAMRRMQQNSDGAVRSLLVGLVVALWMIAGASIGGVVCLAVWFLSNMPPVLKHGEVRVQVGAHVYAAILLVGTLLGLFACFAMRPRSDQETPWRSARLPNKPQEAASREETNRES